VAAAISATVSYIGLHGRSSRTIGCSTRPISTVACHASASGSGDPSLSRSLDALVGSMQRGAVAFAVPSLRSVVS
jgi:hypothetical protein